jgi:uncharacterized membrane protein YdjX (TVP38/TMEM64 family)
MPTQPPTPRFTFPHLWRWRWRILALAATVGLVAWGVRNSGAAELANTIIARLRGAGALWFFTAMALLPAIGFPLLPFSLVAGPAFAPTLGTAGVVVCAILAVAINVALSYALASTWLRPLVEKITTRLGYRLPGPRGDSAWFFITLVRLAPGLPFCMQSFLLGTMRVRFGTYMLISTVVPAGYLTGTIILGDALMQGNQPAVFTALAALAFIGVTLFLIRRRMAAKIPPAAGPTTDPRSS